MKIPIHALTLLFKHSSLYPHFLIPVEEMFLISCCPNAAPYDDKSRGLETLLVGSALMQPIKNMLAPISTSYLLSRLVRRVSDLLRSHLQLRQGNLVQRNQESVPEWNLALVADVRQIAQVDRGEYDDAQAALECETDSGLVLLLLQHGRENGADDLADHDDDEDADRGNAAPCATGRLPGKFLEGVTSQAHDAAGADEAQVDGDPLAKVSECITPGG